MGADVLKRTKDYLIVCFVIIASVLIFIFKEHVARIGEFGYVGIFILCLLSNLTIFIPAPSLMVVVSYSQILSPLIVAVVGSLGTTIGELSGYMFGNAMNNLSVRWNKVIKDISKKIKNVYMLVLVFALIPLPFFDFVGVYAGGKKVKLPFFIIACYLGKFIKMLFYTVFVGGVISNCFNI